MSLLDSANHLQLPMHEVTFSTIDKPKLLSQVHAVLCALDVLTFMNQQLHKKHLGSILGFLKLLFLCWAADVCVACRCWPQHPGGTCLFNFGRLLT